MNAQVGRIMSDLTDQVAVFRKLNPGAITVAIVGVNHASEYRNHEGRRRYQAKEPPIKDAPSVIRRLELEVKGEYAEFLILRYRATNKPPYNFEWVDEQDTRQEYLSALVRISDEYDRRFP